MNRPPQHRTPRWPGADAGVPGGPARGLPAVPGLLQATRDDNELSLLVVNPNGQTHRLLESLGALAVGEQPVGLEEALTAYVGRHGRKSHLLKHLGGLK